MDDVGDVTYALRRRALQQYDVGCPMERIVMDFMGPFPETKAGNQHLLVVMDY